MTNIWHQYGHQGHSDQRQVQGHLKVKIIPESNCKCFDLYHKVSGGYSTEIVLYLFISTNILCFVQK